MKPVATPCSMSRWSPTRRRSSSAVTVRLPPASSIVMKPTVMRCAAQCPRMTHNRGMTDRQDTWTAPTPEQVDGPVREASSAEADFARFAAECAASDDVAARHSSEDSVDSRGGPMSLRTVHVHMIGEYARHNGHADMIRERIDGVTGR
ncbi:DUF664 domain-containing protein [Rhodococcus fascians]|nr:DUF664 domain-containing protein [Rhodococcus fascians]